MSLLESRNPATNEVVGSVPIASPEDVVWAVTRARAAQKEWQDLGATERGNVLSAGLRALGERAEELGALLTQEMGKPLKSAIGEVKSCAYSVKGEIDEIVGALAPETIEDKSTRSVLYRDPFGVCAAITPWNFPISMPHWMCLPALMAGNTVVLKPSEETPLIAQEYVNTLNRHLPEGVLQVIHGADDQGKALVAADVDLIAFTGSREVGKKILQAGAKDLKRVILELGGKDPMIVLEGADLDRSAAFAATNSFRNSGQVCVSVERIYVNRVHADEFIEKLCNKTRELRVGNGMDEGIDIGPMVSTRQRDHVLAQIDDAVAAGAKICEGGEGHHDQFVMPTVLRGIRHDMKIARDETFGPVACVIEVESEAEALQLANDTPFGLGATVFGPKEDAVRVGRQLKSGMIGINKGCGGASGTPWVGAQESGYGFHGGREGHRQFAQVRVVSEPKS